MAHQNPTQPLGKSADNIFVDGEHFTMVTKTKAAVREKLTVNDKGSIVKPASNHDENQPEAQVQGGVPVSLVSDTQPIKRQKTGFEATPTHPTSYVGMPMKTKGITSGPPRASPPTPIVTQAVTTVDLKPKHITPDQVPVAVPTTPRRNKSGVWRTEAMPLRGGAPLNYRQGNQDGGASIKATHDGAESDEEENNDRDDRRNARGLSESPHFATDPRYHEQPVVLPWPKGTLWDHSVSYKTQRAEKEAREKAECETCGKFEMEEN